MADPVNWGLILANPQLANTVRPLATLTNYHYVEDPNSSNPGSGYAGRSPGVAFPGSSGPADGLSSQLDQMDINDSLAKIASTQADAAKYQLDRLKFGNTPTDSVKSFEDLKNLRLAQAIQEGPDAYLRALQQYDPEKALTIQQQQAKTNDALLGNKRTALELSDEEAKVVQNKFMQTGDLLYRVTHSPNPAETYAKEALPILDAVLIDENGKPLAPRQYDKDWTQGHLLQSQHALGSLNPYAQPSMMQGEGQQIPRKPMGSTDAGTLAATQSITNISKKLNDLIAPNGVPLDFENLPQTIKNQKQQLFEAYSDTLARELAREPGSARPVSEQTVDAIKKAMIPKFGDTTETRAAKMQLILDKAGNTAQNMTGMPRQFLQTNVLGNPSTPQDASQNASAPVQNAPNGMDIITQINAHRAQLNQPSLTNAEIMEIIGSPGNDSQGANSMGTADNSDQINQGNQ